MNKLTIKDSSLAVVFGSLLCQVSVGVFLVLATFICSMIGIDLNLDWFTNNCWGYLLCSFVLNSALFLVFFLFKRKKEDKIIGKPKLKKILIYSLLSVVAFFCLYPAISLLDLLFKSWGVQASEIPYSFDTTGFIVSIFSLAILPAIFEELLFRGVIFTGLKEKGKTFAIFISAIMFSLFHFSINQTVYPFIMGLLLGGIMFKENNILYTIIVHFISNILSLAHTYLNIWFVSTHWLYIIIAILMFFVFLTFVLIYAIKHNNGITKEKLNRTDKIFLFASLGIMSALWIIINFINFL